MADTQGTPFKVEDLTESVVAMGTTITKLGATVATLPLAVLPEKARTDATAATNDLFNTVGNLHLSLAKTAIQSLSAATSALNKAIEPALNSATKALDGMAAPKK